MTSECRDLLPEPPNAAWFVLRTLSEHEPITYGDLHYESGLAESTFDDALRRLREAGLVEREQNLRDGRETIYRLSGLDYPEIRGNGED